METFEQPVALTQPQLQSSTLIGFIKNKFASDFLPLHESCPESIQARDHSHCINNGWILSGQPLSVSALPTLYPSTPILILDSEVVSPQNETA